MSEFSDISDLCILMNILEYTTHALLKNTGKNTQSSKQGSPKAKAEF